MHSSVQIGLVYSPVSEAASGGKSKTVKAGDIMAMKVREWSRHVSFTPENKNAPANALLYFYGLNCLTPLLDINKHSY